jgi:DNA-binding NtrC family response regulator
MNSQETLKILVVDDEAEYTMAMEIILESEGYDVLCASSGEMALEQMQTQTFDVIITDLIMGGMDGLELLAEVKASSPDTEVIIITGYGTVQNAVEAMKQGAFTYFVKSHDPEALKEEVAKLRMLCSVKRMHEQTQSVDTLGSFLLETKSPKFKRSLKLAHMAACSNSNILITGESGVGKEVFAKYIHACSKRHDEPFIAINCNAFSDTLLESELFGHEKGAFTGASVERVGRFEAAHKGTLLIDELGEMNYSTQVKLLRTLESKKIERIGGNQPISVDFRLLCATNRDMKSAIESGRFREDLFFRVSTIIIDIPPLRERREDLPDLIEFFFTQSSRELDRKISGIDDDVMDALMNYDYPGNVRELKNMIERLVVLSEEGRVKKKYLFNDSRAVETADCEAEIRPLKEVRKEMEAEYISEALAVCQQNVTKTAKKLGISKRQLFNKINEYHLR